MKIRQVEELVGITKKNIRFYEDQGLLKIERAENGYREYHEKDIRRLKEIKLFRKLDFSLEDIRAMFFGQNTLQYCLHKQLDGLEKQKELLEKREFICQSMLDEHLMYDALILDEWLDKMECMEKEGKVFMDIERNDVRKKKITGALIAALVMAAAMALMVVFVLWMDTMEPLPLGLLLFILAIPALIMVGVIYAVYERIQEIKGGEEDEASKY